MPPKLTLHQKREQLRWFSLVDGMQAAITQAATYAADHGFPVPEDHLRDLAEQSFGASNPDLYIGFYEADGTHHLGIAQLAWSNTPNIPELAVKGDQYRSAHLGTLEVYRRSDQDIGAHIIYRSAPAPGGGIVLHFSGTYDTAEELALASHGLVDDFALTTAEIGARS